MCVSCFAVRTRDVTDVMVRLHIGCDALVRGRARCNATSRTWGPVRRHSRTTRSASCGGDAERAVVVIVVNPGPSRSDLDGWMQSTRVRDDMGSRCGFGAGFDVVVNFGKWQ